MHKTVVVITSKQLRENLWERSVTNLCMLSYAKLCNKCTLPYFSLGGEGETMLVRQQVSEGDFRRVGVVTSIPEVQSSLASAKHFQLVEELKLHSCLLQLCTINRL